MTTEEATQMTAKDASFRTGGWKRIMELAAREKQTGTRRYALYVIEVESLDERVPYKFYIGMTNTSGRHRMMQHSERGDRAWRMFRNGKARPVRLREDLTEGLPRFRTKARALQAEGLLARVISANVGPAYSDQLHDRRKRHEARRVT
jgi:hypothetical protein